jgi:hypothetical protein
MVAGEDEDLRLSRESAKGTRVKDSITITLEARAILVRFLFSGTTSATVTPRRPGNEKCVELFFALAQRTRQRRRARYQRTHAGARVFVGDGHGVVGAFVAAHSCGPTPRAF